VLNHENEGFKVSDVQISVVLPCLDEAETVGQCVESAVRALSEMEVSSEVIVVDNGSIDRSADYARAAGARVVRETHRGYGRAIRSGCLAAEGQWIVLADADGSHDFQDLSRITAPLARGADVVIGSRIRGDMDPLAIPFLHRYLGGPILTFLLNLLHGSNVSDVNCGMRALTAGSFGRMSLHADGMEFASEMIIEATNCDLVVAEVPIHTSPRGGGESKLRTWRDGGRHLALIFGRSIWRTKERSTPKSAAMSIDPTAPNEAAEQSQV